MARDRRDVVTIRTAPPGSGKSYTLCMEVINNFLPNSAGVLWTNVPLNIGPIADYARRFRMTKEDVEARIKIIPKQVLDAWRKFESGPWDYFKQADGQPLDMTCAWVVIDEAHNFIPRRVPRKRIEGAGGKMGYAEPYVKLIDSEGIEVDTAFPDAWMKFGGEIRHLGARLEFITQDIDKLNEVVTWDCGVRLYVENFDEYVLPWVNVRWGDVADFIETNTFGLFRPNLVKVYEKARRDRKEFIRWSNTYVMRKRFYKFYNSYSAPIAGGKGAGEKAYASSFKKYGWFLSNWYLFVDNFYPIVKAGFVLFIVWYMCFGGGFGGFMDGMLMGGQEAGKSMFQIKPAKKELAEPPRRPFPSLGVPVFVGKNGSRIAAPAASPVAVASGVVALPVGPSPEAKESPPGRVIRVVDEVPAFCGMFPRLELCSKNYVYAKGSRKVKIGEKLPGTDRILQRVDEAARRADFGGGYLLGFDGWLLPSGFSVVASRVGRSGTGPADGYQGASGGAAR